MAVLCYAQTLNNWICTAYEYFLDYPFLSRLYEFYLSIKDLETQDEFNILQNLHLYTQKSVCATSTRPFGEVGGMSPLQLSSEHILPKLKIKKLLRKINSKNLTAGV